MSSKRELRAIIKAPNRRTPRLHPIIRDYLWELVEMRSGIWRPPLQPPERKVAETILALTRIEAIGMKEQLSHLAENSPHGLIQRAASLKLQNAGLREELLN